MDKDSKFTRDEEGYVAVRTVSAPYSSGTDDKDSMFTRDEEGYVAVRTISGSGGGGGGGDQHNLGYYATLEALEEAHPTAEAGDWAIVGTTDTVWIWDTDNSEWVDSDQKGQVTSVNSKTGAVVLTAKDVNAIPQYETMPTASASNLGNIVQYIGESGETYTSGYFYENKPTYSDASATISQTVGSGLTNLAVDVEAFETAEQPTGDETVSFVANVYNDLAVTTGTVDNLTVKISNVQLFLQKAKEYIVSQGDNTDIVEISVEVFQESEEHDILFDVDIETASANNYSNILGNDPTQWGIVYSGTISNYNSWYFAIHHSQVQSTLTWSKGGDVVNITTYGVSYTGNPATGDTLTVAYIAGTITGYLWQQIDVQPTPKSEAINWGTSVDIPANTGLGWNCFPIYMLPKPLEDGEYEFYWEKTDIDTNNAQSGPLVKSTYKVRFTIFNNSTNTVGRMMPVIADEYFTMSPWSDWSSYSPLKVQGTTWYLWLDNTQYWGSNIPAYVPDRAVESAFRLSTIKNVNTGEEITLTGTLSNNYPAIDYYVNGNWSANSLSSTPYIPTYHYNSSFNYEDLTSQYIVVFNEKGISTEKGSARCSELDIALSSDNGKYHVVIENGVDNYIATVIEASGELADVQFGYNANNQVIVYLNMQSLPQSGILRVEVGAKGSNTAPNASVGDGTGFSALPATTVGGTIMPNILGKILQYTGTTTASYTNGYFYKANGTIVTVPQSTTAYNISPDTVSISIDADDLIQAIMGYTGWTESYTISMLKELYQWHIKLDDNGNIEYVYWGGWGNFMSDSGVPACFTITDATAGSTTEFYVNYTPEYQEVQNQSWDLVSVQPTYTAPSTMPTLAVADWNNSTQTVNVTGVTATNAVIISPAPASANEYASCGVLCTAQGSGTLTFTCQSTPTNDLTVNVIIL